MNSIENLDAPNGKCKICESAVEPVWGIKGEGETDVLIILQSSDFRALEHSYGYTGALVETLTGKDVVNMIKGDWRNIAIVNSVKCHFQDEKQWRDPKTDEYRNCRENLLTQIEQLKPSLVLCCGSWATKAIFGEENYEKNKPNKYSVRYKEVGDTAYAIATHPRLFTCPVKAELFDMVEKFRRENEVEMEINQTQLVSNFSI